MIIAMKPTATLREITAVIARLEDLGVTPTVSKSDDATIIGIVGGKKGVELAPVAQMAGVAQLVETQSPFKRVSASITRKTRSCTRGRSRSVTAVLP